MELKALMLNNVVLKTATELLVASYEALKLFKNIFEKLMVLQFIVEFLHA